MAFCLSCKQLLSYSGALKHSKRHKTLEGINFSRLFSPDKTDFYKNQILEDIEYLEEKGRFNTRRSNESIRSALGDDSQQSPDQGHPTQREDVEIQQESYLAEQPCPDNERSEDFPVQDPVLEEEWDCVEDFLLSDLSYTTCFDCGKLFERATMVLNGLLNQDNQKRNVMKSRIVTLFLRQLSSILSLSKSQNNKLVEFFKKAMVFISPESSEVSKRIFASYDSCTRQSLKDAEKKHVICKRYMRDCLFFSIAVDTALFRKEHFIACMVKFSFEDKIVIVPLFITQCLVSSGKDLAVFIFNNLKDKDAMFHKLTSVATDGATNMLGKYNGMTANFTALVTRHCRDENIEPPMIHSIWCFAHRMNLVKVFS